MPNYRLTTDWFSWNIPNWERWLFPLAGKPDVRFLEIGCYEGRATLWLLSNILTHETARIDCLDVFEDPGSPSTDGRNRQKPTSDVTCGYESRFDHNIGTDPSGNKVRKLKAASQETLRNLDLYCYDAIYIDGSHIACDVLEDAVLAFRLLRVGGIMIFDDYEWNGTEKPSDNNPQSRRVPDPLLTPRLAIDTFLHLYNGQYELIAKGYQIAIMKPNDDEAR